MAIKSVGLSIFFPCYNDKGTIGKLVKEAGDVARKLTKNFEVIVIDDGSSDGSRELLKSLTSKFTYLKLVFHKSNKGYGGALRSGFKTATKELVFYTDGDAQYDVKELPILWQLMTPDVNFVNGIKMERQDYTYRVIIGNLYALIVRWAYRLPIYDVDCDYRLIRREILKKINLTTTSGAICTELVKKAERAGAKFRQVSVHHYPRTYGQSQFFKLPRLIKTFKEQVKLWGMLMIKENKWR